MQKIEFWHQEGPSYSSVTFYVLFFFFSATTLFIPRCHPCPAGEVSEPRSGAVKSAASHGAQSGAEPLPVPGLVRAQSGVQCHVLHPGAPGRLHQSA